MNMTLTNTLLQWRMASADPPGIMFVGFFREKCLLAIAKYQRVGRLSMWGWRRRALYAILKQKPFNFTTNTLKAD